MQTNLQLQFIREKINALQQALFFSVSNSLLRMPTHLVQVLEADEFGQIWFCVPRPQQIINEFDKEFIAKLDFFRKGQDFFLKVNGKAFIVTDPEEINTLDFLPAETITDIRQGKLVLIRVKVGHADYFENAPKASQGWLKNTKMQLYRWFFNQQQQGNVFGGQKMLPLPLNQLYSN